MITINRLEKSPKFSSILALPSGIPRGTKVRGVGVESPYLDPTALGFLHITMLSLSLITVGLVTIGARAKPTVNDVGRGLDLFLSTPADKVAFASDLRVTSTVKNVGDEDLKILKLGNVLDTEHPTHAFIVTKDGKEVPFNVTRVCPPISPTFCVVANTHIDVSLDCAPLGSHLRE